MKKLLLLCMMCLATLTIQAQKRCVVLDFQIGTNVTEEEIDGISYCFRSNFQPTGYTKVEQMMVTRTIRDFGFSRTDMTQQQIGRVGRELEANIVVVGTMNKFMDEYSVDIRVIDVAKGNTIANESANFQKTNYRDAMEKTAKRLASKLRGGSSTSLGNGTSTGYTDLGLPSGTIWKDINATGFYTYDEAFSQFGNRVPSKEQWEELKAECQWSWNGNGYKVTGPNGNSINLPVGGHRDCNGNIFYDADFPYYWSSTSSGTNLAWCLTFHDILIYQNRVNEVRTNYYQNQSAWTELIRNTKRQEIQDLEKRIQDLKNSGKDIRMSTSKQCFGFSVRLVQN